MAILKDRIKETSSTSGTGYITLAGASESFQSFSAVGDGNVTYYTIQNGNQWEVGQGTYTSGTSTLSRDSVFDSSDNGSHIALSGNSTVFVTYPADKSLYADENEIVNLPTGGIKFSDTTTQTTAGLVAGDNISELVNDSGYINAHPTISAASSSDNSGRTYIQDILLDSNGHVTGVATATETVTDTDTTYTAGDGLDLSGTEFAVDGTVVRSGDNVSVFVNDAGYLTTHPAITAASSSDNSGRTYIQDILLDSNGHVTGVATATETVTDTDTTYTAGTGLTLDGTEFNIDATVLQTGDNVSLLTNDANYIGGIGSENELAKFKADGSLTGVPGLEANTDGDPGLDIFRESGQITTLVNIYTEDTGILTVIDENGWIGIGSGDPSYQLDVAETGSFGALLVSGNGYFEDTLTASGLITAATGITLEQNTPGTTTDKLYNTDGNAYFNGEQLAVVSPVITEAGTSRTLATADAGQYIRTTNASAVTITVPSGLSIPDYSEFTFEQAGAGQITISAAAGVTINTSSSLTSSAQYAVLGIKHITGDTYTAFGDRT